MPYNAASNLLGPPPDLNFLRPAGLDDPNKCFREKGGEALVVAVRSGQITPSLMSSAASCFNGNFSGPGGGGNQGPPGSGGSGGPQGQPYGQLSIFSVDFIKTMSQQRPPAGDCVAKVAGEAAANKMFGSGGQLDDSTREKVFAAGCFGPPSGGPGGPNSGRGEMGIPPGRAFDAPPPGVVECLSKIANSTEVQSGKRVPTPAEFGQGQACYAKAGAMPFFVPPHEVDENSPLAQCAKAVIGVTDISTITPNNLTRDQKQKMRRCYEPVGNQAYAETRPSLPQVVADCVKGILGETVFSQVSTGRLEPSAEERQKVGSCFQNKPKSGIAYLAGAAVPLSQTEALLADVDPVLVPSPTVVAPSEEAVNADPDTAQFALSGASEDVESVDVYVNSEPTITTVATEKGDNNKKTWSSNMAFSSLTTGEEHTAYAVITTKDGKTVRSPLVSFVAKAAPAVAATEGGSSWLTMVVYGSLGVVLLALVAYLVLRRRHKLPV